MDGEQRRALARFLPDAGGAIIEPWGRGLINRTFRVVAGDDKYVLQQVSRIFDPAIHHNIRAVTERLAAVGMVTPRLLLTVDGAPYADLGEAGVWRVMTYVEGVSFDTVQGPAQARAAAELVARFHAALDGMEHRWVGTRLGVHDTARHLANLDNAIKERTEHRLFAEAAPLGREILDGAAALPALPDLPPRACHGDLKINNIIFEGIESPARERALCLVDLDTVGPMALAFELGDAWRSWCNPHGEERAEAVFDLEVFAASLDGYVAGLGRALTDGERRALLYGVEWISLELAARFLGDALVESYFGWDPSRFPGRGEHNLVRARSQWSLHRAVRGTRERRARLLGVD